jgi:peptide/nickel transport system permease protein
MTTTPQTLSPAAEFNLGRAVRAFFSNYAMQRLLKALGTIFFVTSLTFFIVRLMPGNPVEIYIQELQTNQGLSYTEARDQAASLFAIDLDRPMFLQYTDYLGNLLRGNLGSSFRSTGTPVTSSIAKFLPWTVFSVGVALMISFTLGIFLGMVVAYRRSGIMDTVVSTIASIVSAIPNYLIAIMVIIILGVQTSVLPIAKMRGSLSPNMQVGLTLEFIGDVFFHAALPMLVYVLTTIGNWMLLMKSSTTATLEEDYVTVARARGLSDGRITTAYVGRNAALPLFTQLAISIGFVVGGSFLIEEYFVYQGVGLLLLQSIRARDYPVMQGVFLIVTIAVIASNLLADLLYSRLDPRIRVTGNE